MQAKANAKPRRTKVVGRSGIYYRDIGRGKRRYEITYLDSDGRRRWKTVDGNLERAQEALDQVRERMRRGERVAPTKLTLAELVELWREGQTVELRPRTVERYELALDGHIVPRLGRRRVTDITEDDVAGLVVDLRAEGYSAWTVRGDLVALSRVYAFAVRRGMAAFNPVQRLDRSEKPSIPRREMRILDREEMEKLLGASGGIDRWWRWGCSPVSVSRRRSV